MPSLALNQVVCCLVVGFKCNVPTHYTKLLKLSITLVAKFRRKPARISVTTQKNGEGN